MTHNLKRTTNPVQMNPVCGVIEGSLVPLLPPPLSGVSKGQLASSDLEGSDLLLLGLLVKRQLDQG